MAIIKRIASLLPTPPPKNITIALQDWLREGFDNVAESLNDLLSITELNQAFLQNGALDGKEDSIVVPGTPDFIAVTDYTQGILESELVADPVAGTITLPDWPGWVEITLFYSLKQTTAIRSFSLVAHLEIDDVVDLHASGSAYIPQQEEETSLTISSVHARQVTGGEVFRVMFQVEDLVAAGATFDILDCTFHINYIDLPQGIKLFN